jgi:glycosyltransferase involved in cell wall biosynthesis
VIVGDGPLRHTLEREVKRLGLEGVVRFTGWQQDLRSVYERLEIVCLTSWKEGTPVALIEAMAAGRAVVATDVGGIRDLVEEDSQPNDPILPGTFRMTARGVLVRPGDTEGLAAALRRLAGDAGLRGQLGHAARAHVVGSFDEGRLVREIAALYEQLQPGRS